MTFWSAAEIQTLRRMKADKTPDKQIAEALSRTPESVKAKIKATRKPPQPGKAGHWSDAEVRQLRDLRVVKKRSIQQIVEIMSRPEGGVRALLRRHGLYCGGRPQPKPMSDETKATIQRLREGGATYRVIAGAVKRSQSRVAAWCQEQGISAKPVAAPVMRVPSLTEVAPIARMSAFVPVMAAPVAPKAPVKRVCLCCRKPFVSKHVGNRRCQGCLNSAHTWDSPYAP